MTENQTQTVTEINAATDASLRARRTPNRTTRAATKATAKPAATAKPKPTAKPAPKAAPAVKPAPKVRKALTPRERAAKPVTATIASYVDWLEGELGRKLSAAERAMAGISITLYGAYQTSPARRAARGA